MSVQIISSHDLEEAWEAYRKHALRSFYDRELILERGYMEEWAQLEARFKRLSLIPRAY